MRFGYETGIGGYSLEPVLYSTPPSSIPSNPFELWL